MRDPEPDRTREELEAEARALRAENAALGRSEALLRAVVEGIDDPVYVKDREGRYLLVNPAAARSLGRPAAEVLGGRDEDLLPPEEARLVRDDDLRIMASGQARSYEEVLTMSGAVRTFLTTKAPRRDHRGRVVGVVGIAKDITERVRAEAELARQAERLRTIFDHIPVMVCFVDPDERLLLVNREWERVLGWSLEEARVRGIASELYPDPDRRRAVLEYVLDPPPGWAEFRVRVRDGRAIDTAWANVLLSDGTSIGIGLDITERKRAEEALRAGDRQFRAVFEGALDAMILADDQGRYVDVNPAASELFGLPRDSLIGRTGADFAEPGFDLEGAWSAYRRAGVGQGLFRLLRPDGTAREAEFAAKADVLPGRHLSVLRDVTGRRRSEEALARSERRFRLVLENSRDAVYRINLATRAYDYASPSARDVLGYTFEDLAAGGMALTLSLIHPEDLGRVEGHLARLTDPRPEADFDPVVEYRLRVPGKGWRWISDNVSAIRDGGGVPVAIVGSARDVTDKLEAAERLRDLSRRLIRAQEDERRAISRELHDEIGQALTAVKINVRAALRDPAAPSSVGRLEECVGLVERTIGQVRDLSLDLRPSLLDDLGLLEALRSYVAGFSRRTGIAAEFAASGPTGRLDQDVETACYRIAQEALTNVARHSGAGRVRVGLAGRGPDLRLVVADDGSGFDVAAATSRAAGGSSLGVLSMGERATLLGGRVEIDSAPGRGTEVRATFPRPAPAGPGTGDG